VGLATQRRRAARAGCRQTQAGVMAKRIGVVLVPPTLAKEKQNRAQQIG